MKPLQYFITASLLVLLSFSLQAQFTTSSQWTWMKGDNAADQPGVYGTKGIADIANKPGARVYSFSWQDAAGNFWLFGGAGYGETGVGELNDLWKYNPSTNLWTWVSGAKTVNQAGIYGVAGTPSPSNMPGSRDFSVSWVDKLGNFYVFGGRGYDSDRNRGILNDLWKYNPVSNEWTWLTGSNFSDQRGIYGAMGVTSASNNPGARFENVGFTDAAGDFWLLGGVGYDGNSLGYLNDLWKYDPVTNLWTWMKGNNVINQNGVYGTQGIANASNNPGSRGNGTSWTDNAGNFWFFGGEGRSVETGGGTGFFNDLWRYNLASNQWTWVKGDNIVNIPGVYGTQGTANAANKPGARFASANYTDAAGDIWLFGGGYGNASIYLQNYFNDLWKYNAATNEWTWMKGNSTFNEPGVYGTQGTASVTNRPGARYGSGTWKDATGNFWILGGLGWDTNGLDYQNDLWKLNASTTLPVTLTSVAAQAVQNNIQVSWQTINELNTSHFVVERSKDGQSFIAAGSLAAAGNSVTISKYSFTDQHAMQGINYYRIKMLYKDGSTSFSAVVKAIADITNNFITVFPNPVHVATKVTITVIDKALLKYRLYDNKGRLIADRNILLFAGKNNFNIDMSVLPRGVYKAIFSWASQNKTVNILKD